MSRRIVPMHPGVLAAFPGQLPKLAIVDTIWETAGGQKLIVRADDLGMGYVDLWPPTGYRSIASDPAAARRRQ